MDDCSDRDLFRRDGVAELVRAQVVELRTARKALFGAWEGNWVAYNAAQDVRLSGSEAAIPFLMYPHGDVGGVKLDDLSPDKFGYTITAKEITA